MVTNEVKIFLLTNYSYQYYNRFMIIYNPKYSLTFETKTKLMNYVPSFEGTNH